MKIVREEPGNYTNYTDVPEHMQMCIHKMEGGEPTNKHTNTTADTFTVI